MRDLEVADGGSASPRTAGKPRTRPTYVACFVGSRPRACTQTCGHRRPRPLEVVIAIYRTLDDVVAGFSSLEQQFRAGQDRRSIFLTLYGVVSAEMRDRLASRRIRGRGLGGALRGCFRESLS